MSDIFDVLRKPVLVTGELAAGVQEYYGPWPRRTVPVKHDS